MILSRDDEDLGMTLEPLCFFDDNQLYNDWYLDCCGVVLMEVKTNVSQMAPIRAPPTVSSDKRHGHRH